LLNDWFVDTAYFYAESDLDNKGCNILSISRLQNALDGSTAGLSGQYINYIELVNTAREILLTMTQFPSLSEAELLVEIKQNTPENLQHACLYR